jgi:hypothetical protein
VYVLSYENRVKKKPSVDELKAQAAKKEKAKKPREQKAVKEIKIQTQEDKAKAEK